MPLKIERRVNDAVYGPIGITKIENKVIDTPIFQRLRRIRHLGMTDYVFPGATHSRFSHSLGTLHIMDVVSKSLKFEDDERELLRLVALLHDVGHLPFSHAFDDILGEKYQHKEIGKEIIKRSQIAEELKGYFEPEQIINILDKASDWKYSVLIDSDLDVDKIDYLTRDAHHTGLIYGKIDFDYLTRCLFFYDKEQRLAIRCKGRQSLENFLLARYYMFSTLYHHRTVFAFELMMREIYRRLSNEKKDLRISKILKNVNDFASFDESVIWQQIYNYEGNDKILKTLISMILRREPLKLVHEETQLFRAKTKKNFHSLDKLIKNEENERRSLSKASKVPQKWIFIKRLRPMDIMSPAPDEGSIYIELEDGLDKKVIPIQKDPSSIIQLFKRFQKATIRVYTLEKHKDSLKKTIKAFL